MLIATLVFASAAMVVAHESHQQHAGEAKEHVNPLKNTKEQADHIIEELNEIMKTKPKAEMTDKELQFHYFKLHDFDNNNKLDGSEIVKAMTHHHEDPNHPGGVPKENLPPVQPDSELAGIIDAILSTDDTNKDGYIDFLEFMKSNGEA